MTHKITLERNSLRFSAAHFATYGDECEPLHGHNYDVFVEIEGDLTGDSWVLDFSEGKRVVAGICKELDHRFLLPLDNPSLSVSEATDSYEIVFAARRYVMPKEDVAALPIDNTTAERLAEWFASRIVDELGTRVSNLTRLTVGVEEAPGQAGWFTRRLR